MHLFDLSATNLQVPLTNFAQPEYETWWTEFVKWLSYLGTEVIKSYCSSMFLTDSDILGTIDTCWTDFITWLSRPGKHTPTLPFEYC